LHPHHRTSPGHLPPPAGGSFLFMSMAWDPKTSSKRQLGSPGGAIMFRLQLAVEQIGFARNYTVQLLDQTSAREWFRQPSGGVIHITLQVGHLAMTEYWLALERMRGSLPQDADLMAEVFLRLFGRESVLDPDPKMYPSQTEIRAVFDGVL